MDHPEENLPLEDQTPPPNYEPQVVPDGLQPGIVERPPDDIDLAEDEIPDEQSEDDGAADDGDDEADEGGD